MTFLRWIFFSKLLKLPKNHFRRMKILFFSRFWLFGWVRPNLENSRFFFNWTLPLNKISVCLKEMISKICYFITSIYFWDYLQSEIYVGVDLLTLQNLMDQRKKFWPSSVWCKNCFSQAFTSKQTYFTFHKQFHFRNSLKIMNYITPIFVLTIVLPPFVCIWVLPTFFIFRRFI